MIRRAWRLNIRLLTALLTNYMGSNKTERYGREGQSHSAQCFKALWALVVQTGTLPCVFQDRLRATTRHLPYPAKMDGRPILP
jgi:hypothetical protein